MKRNLVSDDVYLCTDGLLPLGGYTILEEERCSPFFQLLEVAKPSADNVLVVCNDSFFGVPMDEMQSLKVS